jgi:glucose/arabinose dehydrogenase
MKKFTTMLFLIFSVSVATSQFIELDLVQNGFNNPVNLQNAGDERLFVVEQGGRIKIMQPNGDVNADLFLDISSQISSGGERGLLGLAFHPDYSNNGFFYVYYTKPNGDSQISRFSVDSNNPDLADPGSELPLLDFEQPFSNHNGGCLAFGPDGFLYISSGDGGSGGDPGNRAQNTTLLLGKLLRIDVDIPSGGNNYSIPSDNPFVGSTANAQEIWAYGLRNPWKFSFDSANGDIWIGDVGQGEVEEIDKAALIDAGLNYGWRCYEGSEPFNTAGCPPVADLTFPIAEYSSASNTSNCSITGGNVYRGTEYPDFVGLYFFADVCSGLIGTVDQNGNLTEHGTFGGSWVSFGEDVNNELYIVSITGSISRVRQPVELGIEENIAETFEMFPNPASESVTLKLQNNKIEAIFITDVKGSIVLSNSNLNTSRTELNVSDLNTGFYLVNVKTVTGHNIVKKLVIK